jgi:4-hydroxymandelate oxidase
MTESRGSTSREDAKVDAPINLADVRALAERAMEPSAWDYYRSGAHDEHTLAENEHAWARIAIRYRVLVDVASRQMSTRVLDVPVSSPILVAPTAFHGLAHPEAERASAAGAGDAGSIFVLSSLSNTPIEEVVAATTGPVWFQLYVYRDRAATAALIARAEAAGCSALVLTVDAPLLGRRERDERNRFHLPDGLEARNLTADGRGLVAAPDAGSGLFHYVATQFDPSLSYRDLEQIASQTKLPVLVKGVVRGDDAVRAIEHGARGIVVSNHGGRQLDTSVATAVALREVVAAVDGISPDGERPIVLVDGGIRRGTDVLKAIALGADGVLVGRPVLWGLAWDGRAGVHWVLDHLKTELDLAMALAGCPDIASIEADLLAF